MTHAKPRLILAASAAALLTACAGMGAPGFGEADGCRTVYVFTGGGIQAISSCGGVPREATIQRAMISSAPVGEADPDAPAPPVVAPVSTAALATAPHDAPPPYASPNAMIENADMAAFMARVRADYAHGRNAAAWGYGVIDALAADDPATAQAMIDGMEGKSSSDWMSVNHLRPWVYAFNGRAADAMAEMAKLRRLLPGATARSHRALLAEGLGDHAAALAVYAEMPRDFSPPDPAEAGTMNYFAGMRAFNAQRQMALREAELLRGLGRDDEAIAILTRLLAAAPDDAYVEDRLEKARRKQDRWAPRTLKQAMAQALGDEAEVIEEQEMMMSAMAGRGAKAPFNHLLSSIRQSALLLDPDNGDIRISEAGRLYTQGKFEPALRIAQIGNPPKAQAALLLSTAGLAALQLGSADTLEVMVERSLKIDNSPAARIQAAGSLTSAGKTARALQLVDQAMREKKLSEAETVFALLTRAQAHSQAGDMAKAVAAAREARAIRDDEQTRQFLSSLLVDTPERPEGLAIMRKMLADDPDDTGKMNNFGYSLVDGYASQEELDEGFRLLKQAIRLTPDEANLLDSIGWAYYPFGGFREGKRFIEMAIREYEPFIHWELSDHMGDIQWRLGDHDAAREHWRKALTGFPPALNARSIEAKLKDGLATPAPVRRDTPEVPLTKPDTGVSDI